MNPAYFDLNSSYIAFDKSNYPEETKLESTCSLKRTLARKLALSKSDFCQFYCPILSRQYF